MTTAQIIAFNIAILGALITPGPAFLVILRSALNGGRGAGIRTGLGLALGAVTWSALALAGLSALFALVPTAYLVMKFIGAAYLIWFAYRLWRDADKPVTGSGPKRLKGFTLGFAANLANPKAVFFIAAIFSTIFPREVTLMEKGMILTNHLALEITFYSLTALVFTTTPVRAAYLRAKRWLDRIAAACLGLLAIRLAS